MLDKIMEMVGGDALKAMTEKAGISMDQAQKMLPMAGESLQEGLLSQITSGNVDGVLSMFKSFTGGGLESNSLFGNIKNMFMQKIMVKMGLPESLAGLVAGSGMTSIIGNLTGKIQEAGDSKEIDASSLMSVLGGGEGMLGNIAGMVGGNKEGGVMGSIGKIAGGFFGK